MSELELVMYRELRAIRAELRLSIEALEEGLRAEHRAELATLDHRLTEVRGELEAEIHGLAWRYASHRHSPNLETGAPALGPIREEHR